MTETRTDIARNARDYARIEAAILYLEAHFRDQPSLATVAREAGLGPHHFQRLFRRWAGISPQALRPVPHAGLRQGAARSIRLDPGCHLRRGPLGPGPAARPLRHLRGDEPRRLQATRRGRGYRLGRASEPLRPLLRRADRARHLRAGLRRSRWQRRRGRPRGVRRPLARRALPRGPRRHRRRGRAHLRRAPGRRRAAPPRPSPAPTSSSRCGRRCFAFRPAGSPHTGRWRKPLGCRRAPARWAAPSPPIRSLT